MALVAAVLAALAVTACAQSPTAPSAVGASVASSAIGATAAASGLAQRSGHGNTPLQLTRAGWRCLNVPGHGVHCEDPHWNQHGVHIQVKVFDTSDTESNDAPFLGTESLVRGDHYKGQPCLPGHGEYFLIPGGPRAGYYACHHFDF